MSWAGLVRGGFGSVTGQEEGPTSSSRRSRLRTLPCGLRGSGSERNQMWVGTMKAARRLLHVEGQLVGRHLGARAQDDDGADLLAERLVGDADHGAVGDRRVFEQGRLDLDGVDVLPAPDDHVLGPVDDVDEALVVQAGDVARVQPAPGERRAPTLRAGSSSRAPRWGL